MKVDARGRMQNRLRRACGTLSSWALVGSTSLHSGLPADLHPRLRAVAIPAPMWHVSADTGDFATTAPAYGQYATPLWCMAAVTNAVEVSHNNFAAQTVRQLGVRRAEEDTMPAAAQAIARTCSARFTVANTSAADLPDLFQLALAAGNDPLAQAVLTTLLGHAETPQAKAEQLVWSIQKYVAAQPGRITAAEAAAAQLDALGPEVLLRQVAGHYVLVKGASAYLDRPLMQRQVTQLTAVTRGRLETLKPNELEDGFKVWDAYLELLRLTWLVAPDSTAPVVQQLQMAFSPPGVQQNLTRYCHLPFHHCAPPITVTPMEQIPIADLTAAVLASQGLPAPTPASALNADVWFPPPQSGTHGGAADTVQPAAGRFSIIYRWGTEKSSCGRFALQGCTGDLLFLKAMLARYGKDLTVTMEVDADSLTALDVPDTPKAIAASYQWYFHTYLNMPVTVAVRMRKQATQFPAPDGRVFFGATNYDDPYVTHAMTLVNPQQQILFAAGSPLGNVQGEDTGMLALVLERAMHHQVRSGMAPAEAPR